jgi:CHAD domain-containing protein
MIETLDLLDRPARRSARIIALALLDEASRARRRLDQPDVDAIHDFRVAVRRLRSWLRSLDDWLEGSIPKKSRRRLARAARATGTSRDAEVHLEWLREQRNTLNARQRYGLDWLVERIQSEKEEADARTTEAATTLFDRARDKLAETLPVYTARVDQDEDAETFAVVMAGLLRARAERLAKRIRGIESFADAPLAHKARIAAKRLRYLLEPIAEDVESGTALVRELASLQDTLGDWNDVHVFSKTIVDACEQAGGAETRRTSTLLLEGDEMRHALRAGSDKRVTRGLLALAERLRERGEAAYAVARDNWLATGDVFVTRVERIASALEARSGLASERGMRASGNRAGPEQMEKELDEQGGRNGRRDDASPDARGAHELRAERSRARSLEQPAIREAPTA